MKFLVIWIAVNVNEYFGKEIRREHSGQSFFD